MLFNAIWKRPQPQVEAPEVQTHKTCKVCGVLFNRIEYTPELVDLCMQHAGERRQGLADKKLVLAYAERNVAKLLKAAQADQAKVDARNLESMKDHMQSAAGQAQARAQAYQSQHSCSNGYLPGAWFSRGGY